MGIKRKPTARELTSLAPPELNGIIQRLAIFEPPGTIARGYGIREAVVWEVFEQHKDAIWKLRMTWKEWISKVEPLCNKSNAVIFLGNLARKSARSGLTKDALAAYQEMRKVFEEATAANPQDLRIVEMVQQANFEFADRMISEAARLDEERLAFEPPHAHYFGTDEKITDIAKAAKDVETIDGLEIPLPEYTREMVKQRPTRPRREEATP